MALVQAAAPLIHSRIHPCSCLATSWLVNIQHIHTHSMRWWDVPHSKAIIIWHLSLSLCRYSTFMPVPPPPRPQPHMLTLLVFLTPIKSDVIVCVWQGGISSPPCRILAAPLKKRIVPSFATKGWCPLHNYLSSYLQLPLSVMQLSSCSVFLGVESVATNTIVQLKIQDCASKTESNTFSSFFQHRRNLGSKSSLVWVLVLKPCGKFKTNFPPSCKLVS